MKAIIKKIIFYLVNILRRKITNKRALQYKNLYISATPTSMFQKKKHSSRLKFDDFLFFDETSKYVLYLDWFFILRFLGIDFCKKITTRNNKILINDNNLTIKSCCKHNDWSYYYTNAPQGNFRLEFDVTFNSIFKEFQIAFKHKSLFERLRFRIVDNRVLAFEIVENGIFFNEFLTVPFRYEINRKYHFCIEVYNYAYSFYSDNKCLMHVIDKKRKFKDGGIGIVTWEDNYPSNIDCTLENIIIYKLL